MHRRLLAVLFATGCLIVILGCGVAAWGIHQRLIQAPAGIAQLGNLELMAFTDVEFSTTHPPRSYYTIWVTVRKDSPLRPRLWRPLLWAHRLVRLEIALPTSVLERL